MKTSTYLSVFGLLGIAFGLGFLLFTRMTLPMYGLPVDAANLVQGRYFGSTLASLGVFVWLVRNASETSIQKGVLLACAFGSALGVVVSIWGLMDKVLGPLAWSSVVIYGLLLLGSLYCLASARRPTLA